MAFKPWWWTEYLMMRMVVVGLWSEGVKTTATSLVSQGCSSRRRTPSPITSSSFSPACSKICIKKINKISRREIESTKTGIYLGRWRQQSKLWCADVDREGADVKPAKKKKKVRSLLWHLLNLPCKLRTNHLERRSSASRGAGYKERIRTSTDTTEEEGFFSVNVFT